MMPEATPSAAIHRITSEYEKSSEPWIIGFSGGKDSSALLRLTYNALLGTSNRRRSITVVYCDTGVDIPVVASLVRRTLRELALEARSDRLPFDVQVARPRLDDRYFVKVIGRGYAPPSNKFRWCTDRLRIDPIRRIIEVVADGEPATILLGLRQSESLQRNRTMARHRTGDPYRFRQSGSSVHEIFAPLVDFDSQAVWSALYALPRPLSIHAHDLATLYRAAGNECPIVRDPRGAPCGIGRFGCWTCTVVRKDTAMRNMVTEGHSRLAPLLGFRNWLASIRAEPRIRCARRRNGARGLGPITLDGRRRILRELLRAENLSRCRLIGARELVRIKQLWRQDRSSPFYLRLERLMARGASV